MECLEFGGLFCAQCAFENVIGQGGIQAGQGSARLTPSHFDISEVLVSPMVPYCWREGPITSENMRCHT